MLNSSEHLKEVSIRSVYFVGCFVASVLVFTMFLRVGITGFKGAMFENVINGTAPKPWAYRALLPFGVRTISSALPEEVKSSLNQKLWNIKKFRVLNKKWRWEKSSLTEYLIACGLMYLSLVGFFLAFRYLFNGVYQAPRVLLDFTSLLALFALPAMFRFYSYIYDFANLLFFTLCLALMARRKWLLFLLVYALSCFNKETTILLSLLFTIYFYFCSASRLDKPLFVRLLSIQLIIYFVVRAILFYFFHENVGTFTYMGLVKHNLLIFPYPLSTVVGYLCVILMVLYKWKEKPLFLKCGLWMLVPLLSLCLYWGFLDELRDYYEVYPLVILLLAHTVGDILGWNARSALVE